eukprot:1146468-Pelagomonas_calceolata.AAC.9
MEFVRAMFKVDRKHMQCTRPPWMVTGRLPWQQRAGSLIYANLTRLTTFWKGTSRTTMAPTTQQPHSSCLIAVEAFPDISEKYAVHRHQGAPG